MGGWPRSNRRLSMASHVKLHTSCSQRVVKFACSSALQPDGTFGKNAAVAQSPSLPSLNLSSETHADCGPLIESPRSYSESVLSTSCSSTCSGSEASEDFRSQRADIPGPSKSEASILAF